MELHNLYRMSKIFEIIFGGCPKTKKAPRLSSLGACLGFPSIICMDAFKARLPLLFQRHDVEHYLV